MGECRLSYWESTAGERLCNSAGSQSESASKESDVAKLSHGRAAKVYVVLSTQIAAHFAGRGALTVEHGKELAETKENKENEKNSQH